MDEKTRELRDIFTSVTHEESVTESQEDTRGSLERNDRTVEDRLESVITRMRERYAFETPLSDAELIDVATGFYEERTDADLADDLDVSEESVFEARMAMHLVGAEDADEVDLAAIRDREEDDAVLATEYGVSEEQIRRYRRIAAARDESRAVNDRYREEFDSVLADSELASRLATDVREDGLEDATEGMETDVSF